MMNPRQLNRAKVSIGLALTLFSLQAVSAAYTWNGSEFSKLETFNFERGQVVEYTNLEEFCHR